MMKRDCDCERLYHRNSPVDAAIRDFHEGLECCCIGLRQIECNNCCRGTRNISEGLCKCERALNTLCRCLGNNGNREQCKGLRKCRNGLNDIRCGLKAICCGDIRDGVDDVEAGIETCKQGLSMIENAEENCDCRC